MKKIRAFIAIPLSAEVRSQLEDISKQWANDIPERAVRWVRPELMHITLRFLGDTSIASLPQLIKAMDKVTEQRHAFALSLDDSGCFPNSKRPRVVWVGLSGQIDAARLLKNEIDEALIPLGWEKEGRSFRPHLTIGRVKDSRKVKGFQWQANIDPLPVHVRAIQLIESQLQRDGPIYTVRHSSFLQD